MADSTSPIDQLAASQANKELRINELIDAAVLNFGRRGASTSGLVWGYYGGRWGSAGVIANGTHTCGASTTVYMVVNRLTGVVSFATTTTNWDNLVTYGRAYKIVAGASSITSYEDHRTGPGGILYTPAEAVVFQLACSDRVTPLSAATNVGSFRAPYAFVITAVRGSLKAASDTGAVTIDINVGGSTILSTKLTFDQGETTTTTAAAPAVISSGVVTDDQEITVDIDGGGNNATGLIITLIGRRGS